MQFEDLFELATMSTWYKDILNQEYNHKDSTKGIYYKDPNMDANIVESEAHVEEDNTTEIGFIEVVAMRPYTCRAFVKPLGTWKICQ